MSVSDRGPGANFCWEVSVPIMARGCFVGLFLQGVARQATGTGAEMMGELGGRVSAWKRTLERATCAHAMTTQCDAGIGMPVSPGHLVGTDKVSFAPKGAGPVACEITKPCRLWDGGSVSGRMKSLAA